MLRRLWTLLPLSRPARRPEPTPSPAPPRPFSDGVSVVIPAFNAATTLGETIASLRAQTHPRWEAIIVDDGSTDATGALAAAWAARDPRITHLGLAHVGVGAARNEGIAEARFEWVLFLDADDLVRPTMLARTLAALEADRTLDAVYCGWGRLAPGGVVWDEQFAPPQDDMFRIFGRWCAIHTSSCLVRCDAVEEAGGFDPSLVTCQDWDLWQRLSRAGVRFGGVHETLSLYRVRPGSASFDVDQMIGNGMRVIATGHARDPRVARPLPQHLHGLPADDLPLARVPYLCWVAGLALGRGEDARPLFAHLERRHVPNLYRQVPVLADILFPALLLPDARTPHESHELWHAAAPGLHDFLLALEDWTMTRDLAAGVERRLEGLVARHSPTPRPLAIGRTRAVRVEVTEPSRDLEVADGVERLLCDLELEGERIGTVELPVCDGGVAGDVVADAVAGAAFWPILRRWFERTIYPDLRRSVRSGGTAIWRGSACLVDGLSDLEAATLEIVHDRIGWTVFLQELFGRPEWESHRFCRANAHEAATATAAPRDGWLVVEASADLPDVPAIGVSQVLVTVGGAPLGVVPLARSAAVVPAAALRAAIVLAGGLELVRVAVREGLLGKSLDAPERLRDRLAAAAASKAHDAPPARELPPAMALPSGWPPAAQRALGASAAVLSRPSSDLAIGTRAARRATLPMAVLPDLAACAALNGEPILEPEGGAARRIAYLPELIWQRQGASASARPAPSVTHVPAPLVRDRHHYETRHATGDPTDDGGTCAHVHELLLALLPPRGIQRALEIGCGDGRLTARLTTRVERLVGVDVARVAVTRAAERCRDEAHVRFLRLDLLHDPLPGRFDLVICNARGARGADVGVAALLAGKLGASVESPGDLLVVLEAAADPLAESLDALAELRLMRELRTSRQRIRLYHRHDPVEDPPPPAGSGEEPEIVFVDAPAGETADASIRTPDDRHADAAPLAPDTTGDPPSPTTASVLPILMYHRVAPTGLPATQWCRIHPDAFAQHLRALDDAGFYTVSLATWAEAVAARRPLPGRPMVLTFDDATQDFADYAWPLLRRHGFRALVFVVAGLVGETNTWDAPLGESIPLLDWETLRRLRDEGVELGSHSLTHRHMSGLAPAEMAHEAAHSRIVLERALAMPVRTIAYPFGDTDGVVEQVVGACGYRFGITTRDGLAQPTDDLLALPRLGIGGRDDFRTLLKWLQG